MLTIVMVTLALNLVYWLVLEQALVGLVLLKVVLRPVMIIPVTLLKSLLPVIPPSWMSLSLHGRSCWQMVTANWAMMDFTFLTLLPIHVSFAN